MESGTPSTDGNYTNNNSQLHQKQTANKSDTEEAPFHWFLFAAFFFFKALLLAACRKCVARGTGINFT